MAAPVFSNYPNGFPIGLTIQQIPITISNPGKTFWVYSGTVSPPGGIGSSDSNPGSFTKPWATLAGGLANSAVVASRGDVIMVKPGHTETISTATYLNLSKAGVAIVGLGSGSLRPTFTLDTANTATTTISAASVSIQNCVFVANFLAIAAMFTLTTAKGFVLSNCEIRDTSASLNFINVISTSSTTADNDGLTVVNNKIFGLATSGAVKLIAFLGTQDRVTVDGNYYASPTTGTGAVFPITAGKIVTNLLLTNNMFNLVNATGTATAYLITTNGSTNSGMINNNQDWSAPTSPLAVTASSGFVWGGNNLHSNTADLQGYLVPAADS